MVMGRVDQPMSVDVVCCTITNWLAGTMSVCVASGGVRGRISTCWRYFFFFFFILRRMGKNRALAGGSVQRFGTGPKP